MNKFFYEPQNADEYYPPVRKHAGDAGLDIAIQETVKIPPGATMYLPTYVRFELEEGYCAQIMTRSSTFKKDVVVIPTLIDRGYTGYISTIVTNYNVYPVVIEKGTRLSQVILQRYFTFDNETASNIDRGASGLGSSGE